MELLLTWLWDVFVGIGREEDPPDELPFLQVRLAAHAVLKGSRLRLVVGIDHGTLLGRLAEV